MDRYNKTSYRVVNLTVAFDVNIHLQMYCPNISNKKLLIQLAFQFKHFLIFNSMNKNDLALLLDGHCIIQL